MAYSYDAPLVRQHAIPNGTFTAAATITLPCRAVAALAHGRGSRVLNEATVLGVTGVVTTVGTGTINIGDGTTANRYGVFTISASQTLNGALEGTLVLTEEGFRMGVADSTVPSTFVLTLAGTAVLSNAAVIIGHF